MKGTLSTVWVRAGGDGMEGVLHPSNLVIRLVFRLSHFFCCFHCIRPIWQVLLQSNPIHVASYVLQQLRGKLAKHILPLPTFLLI